MELLRLALLCAVCLLPVLVLRGRSPEQAFLLILAIAAVVLARVLALTAPVLLKTVAAALVTRLCADLCRDGGSQAMAAVVELAGAAAALLIALPLLEAVAGLLLGYFT